MTNTSILASEAAHFGALAGDWWDPDGASAMLHKLNPVRLAYVRDMTPKPSMTHTSNTLWLML